MEIMECKSKTLDKISATLMNENKNGNKEKEYEQYKIHCFPFSAKQL